MLLGSMPMCRILGGHSAFCKYLSTEISLYTFHSQSHDQLHSQTKVTALILLDTSVAFDTVDHAEPLHCPKQLAIRETTLAPRQQRRVPDGVPSPDQ